MRLSFVFPAALWLLVLALPLWLLALGLPHRLGPLRFWSSLLLRTTILIALILATAGAQLVRPVERLTTVFLLDSSDSVSPSAREQAEAFVQEALGAMQPGDAAAVVVFGENALVERAPSNAPALERLGSVPITARTNIQDALQLGLALLPADTQKRLVLLSDGGENSGNALEAGRLAASRGVPIDYVDLSGPRTGGEVLVTSLEAPANARLGQEFELVATVESSVAQAARLRFFGDDKLLSEQEVRLEIGRNTFTLPATTQEHGFRRYRAEVAPQVDGHSQNNRADRLVRVGDIARILLVEGKPGEARNFGAALSAARIMPEIVAPEDVPDDLAGLSAYEAVILVNVPVRALSINVIANLPLYVRELGRGLVMIGGERSFGIGGYSHTPIEEALPVTMDVRDRKELPDVGVVFVLDSSGSMDACHCSDPDPEIGQTTLRGFAPKIDIAKDAVLQISGLLGERDSVGVISFDNAAKWALPLRRGATAAEVQGAISTVAPFGDSNLRAGLLAAEEALLEMDARIKHAILLTDGWSFQNDDATGIVRRMHDAGITVSVVATGRGSDEYLRQLAQDGGGRYYQANDTDGVPQVFLRETVTVAGNYLVEERFTPHYAAPSPVLAGLTYGLPELYGYNGTTAKETATTVLVGLDDAPLLAQWQYGLGRAVAWTSDTKGLWARDWVRWPAFPRFAAQLVGWVLPSGSLAGVSTELHSQGAQTLVEVTVQDPSGAPRAGLSLRATLLGANGFTQSITLHQIAPGQYRASIASPAQGTYLVQLTGSEDGQVVVQDTAGLAVPYSTEYRTGQSNPALLEALAQTSGGARLDAAREAFREEQQAVTQSREIGLPLLLLALLLSPLDIALRRLLLRRADFGALLARSKGGT